MKWNEVRKIYPNKFLKLEILESYIDKDKIVITDVNVIKVIEDNKQATKELLNCDESTVVYHTSNEVIEIIRIWRSTLKYRHIEKYI